MSEVPEWAMQFMPLDAAEKAAEIRMNEELKQATAKIAELQHADCNRRIATLTSERDTERGLRMAADQENDRLRAERDAIKQQVERLSAPVIPNSEQLENFRSSYFANGRDWKENTLRILSRWEERDRQAIIASRTAPAPQPTTPPEEQP